MSSFRNFLVFTPKKTFQLTHTQTSNCYFCRHTSGHILAARSFIIFPLHTLRRFSDFVYQQSFAIGFKAKCVCVCVCSSHCIWNSCLTSLWNRLRRSRPGSENFATLQVNVKIDATQKGAKLCSSCSSPAFFIYLFFTFCFAVAATALVIVFRQNKNNSSSSWPKSWALFAGCDLWPDQSYCSCGSAAQNQAPAPPSPLSFALCRAQLATRRSWQRGFRHGLSLIKKKRRQRHILWLATLAAALGF